MAPWILNYLYSDFSMFHLKTVLDVQHRSRPHLLHLASHNTHGLVWHHRSSPTSVRIFLKRRSRAFRRANDGTAKTNTKKRIQKQHHWWESNPGFRNRNADVLTGLGRWRTRFLKRPSPRTTLQTFCRWAATTPVDPRATSREVYFWLPPLERPVKQQDGHTPLQLSPCVTFKGRQRGTIRDEIPCHETRKLLRGALTDRHGIAV